MVLVADGGGGGGGGGKELLLDSDQLKMIVGDLQKIVDDLDESRNALLPIGDGPFGDSWYGGFVREHSEKALLAVTEALSDNSKALLHYEAALRAVEKDANATEEAVVAATAKTRQQVELGADCSDTGAGSTTTTCQVP